MIFERFTTGSYVIAADRPSRLIARGSGVGVSVDGIRVYTSVVTRDRLRHVRPMYIAFGMYGPCRLSALPCPAWPGLSGSLPVARTGALPDGARCITRSCDASLTRHLLRVIYVVVISLL